MGFSLNGTEFNELKESDKSLNQFKDAASHMCLGTIFLSMNSPYSVKPFRENSIKVDRLIHYLPFSEIH